MNFENITLAILMVTALIQGIIISALSDRLKAAKKALRWYDSKQGRIELARETIKHNWYS